MDLRRLFETIPNFDESLKLNCNKTYLIYDMLIPDDTKRIRDRYIKFNIQVTALKLSKIVFKNSQKFCTLNRA